MTADMDRIYRSTPQEMIPWNVETPPEALVDLVESVKVRPCRAIDFGCGTGNYAIYLATRGFDVTGIDLSPAAIEIAKENAAKKGVKCQFIVADILGDLAEIGGTFNFAYDWEVLHHIFPEERKRYVEHVYRLLNAGGKYISACFSEDDREFGGAGKYVKTQLNTVLYLSSTDELRELFEPCFDILEIKKLEMSSKFGTHDGIFVFMEKRNGNKIKKLYSTT
jgi:SAM-dependent methyltransferase